MSFLIEDTAPALLIDKIAELNSIIVKHKAKDINADGLKFYEDLVKVMQLAFVYMSQTRHLYARNDTLEGYVRLLSEENTRLNRQLNRLNTLGEVQLNENYDKEMELARLFTDKALKINDTVKAKK